MKIVSQLPMKLVCALALFVALQVSALAADLDGHWKIEWPCLGATGPYEERCESGDRDVFEIDLWTNGQNLCAYHRATAQLGNRVDEDELGDLPSIVGHVSSGASLVAFKSSWGGGGVASITANGDYLKWKIVSRTEGQSWLPGEAVLRRQSDVGRWKHGKCDSQ